MEAAVEEASDIGPFTKGELYYSKRRNEHQGLRRKVYNDNISLNVPDVVVLITNTNDNSSRLFVTGARGKIDKSPPFVQLCFDNEDLKFQIHTGASISLMNCAVFRRCWPKRPLQKTDANLETYTGETVETIVSDNRAALTGSEFHEFMKHNGIEHVRCNPYFPTIKGQVGRDGLLLKEDMTCQAE
ncbi:hypothetical protein PoB_002697200 [Plakobranchus ocellatus]|uniref:Integrase catalytic domain-containing protein n=1 Tax=Plakobranchus ocellatus TaxID=259542 RepID=A0AAV4A0P1_9GAST|nr:hypothetical protein PoB_002697200 [Plakobranchus ocellatus]